MKNRLYRCAVALAVLVSVGFIAGCVGTFHADNVDWKVEKRDN